MSDIESDRNVPVFSRLPDSDTFSSTIGENVFPDIPVLYRLNDTSNWRSFKGKVDTGAQLCLVAEDVVRRRFGMDRIDKSKSKTLHGLKGEVRTIGQIKLSVLVGPSKKPLNVPFEVVPDSYVRYRYDAILSDKLVKYERILVLGPEYQDGEQDHGAMIETLQPSGREKAELQMAESTEVSIEIFDPDLRRYIPLHAMLVQNVSFNIIQRSCLEALHQPWEPFDGGISYNFSDYASPPLGQCELDWTWNTNSSTVPDIFIVVEEVKGNPYGIILAPSARQRPVVPRSNDIFTIGVHKRTKEQQQEQKENAKLAAQRRPGEKVLDDAKIQERRMKRRQEEQEADARAKLA